MISVKHSNERERGRAPWMEEGEKENGTPLLHISIPKTMIEAFKACYSAN